jgi:hypothetical protein
MKLIRKWALIFTTFFSVVAFFLLAIARMSGTASVYGATVTLKQVGICSISVDGDRTWTVLLEHRWKFSAHVFDQVRFKPNPCSVYSIIFDQNSEAILATIQVPGGMIHLPLSKQNLF